MSVDIPYESYNGSFLGGRFQLQRLRCQEDDLDIYSVTNLSGLSFEAQAFPMKSPPSKVVQARKRRMKRLHQSKNFVCEIQQAGKRFLIIDIKRTDAEWNNLVPGLDWPVTDRDSCIEDFPDLSVNRSRRESLSSDSSSSMVRNPSSETIADILQGANSLYPSRPASSLDSRSSCSSYAEVASMGLEHEKSSKTSKGVRQRQRRQRKRAGQHSTANPKEM